MTQPFGHTVTTTAFSKRVGYYYDEAIRHAVGLERHGEVRVVMVPADEYASLRKLMARALKQEQLTDVIEEITGPPSFHSEAPDTYEDADDRGNGKERTSEERHSATA